MSKTEDKTQLNFDISKREKEIIEQLKNSTGATSGAEVMKRALRIYETLIHYRQEGFQALSLVKEEKMMIIPMELL